MLSELSITAGPDGSGLLAYMVACKKLGVKVTATVLQQLGGTTLVRAPLLLVLYIRVYMFICLLIL